MRFIALIFLLFLTFLAYPQGRNNIWLLGNDNGWPNQGRFIFDTNSYNLINEQRQMAFWGTQATISDNYGNFLMSSNGVWIANANNNLMSNGDDLNPGAFVNSWQAGLPLPHANIILPYPADSTKYILFHHSATFNGWYNPTNELFYSIIDITLDNGLGEVVAKNNLFFTDTLNWGFAACRHANGRDWWIVTQKDTSDIIFKFLLTPNGITYMSYQNLNVPLAWGNVTQLTFSQDGLKFAYQTYIPYTDTNFVLLFDFDRCSGLFSNSKIIDVTDGSLSFGIAFSPNSEFLYASSTTKIFQINTTTLFVDTVAFYDGFISGLPPNCCATTFMLMYLAGNGKIYITSGSSVQHLHEMNYPDSAGTACDVQQHNIALQNYWHLRAVPNHPNYYLGAVIGSVCDSLGVGLSELEHDFKFSIYPNPSNGDFRIMYLLPQNKKGLLEVFDVNGRRVFNYNLPQWSTLQQISLPANISNGLYNCVITSDGKRVSRKIAIIK